MDIEITTETTIKTITGNYRDNNYGRGRSKSRERHYTGNFRRDDRSSSTSRSSSRVSTNRDRIKCYICREYDHFANYCPNSDTEGESEQRQQMYNLDENQTAL